MSDHTLEYARAKYPTAEYHPLLITEVTRMQHDHFCIAAYDIHDRRMARPLRPKGDNWIFDEFQPPFRPGHLVKATPTGVPHGQMPHRTEDMLLKSTMTVLETWTAAEVFSGLLATTCETVAGAFGQPPLEDRYFIEGTQCPSLGGVRIERRRIAFRIDAGGRLRLHVEDTDGTVYSFAVTCDRLRYLFDRETGKYGIAVANRWLEETPPTDPIILRVGLARGYAGASGEFIPKRCYLQINGVLTRHPFGNSENDRKG